MDLNDVLTVGFIAAATAFFSKRLGLEDKKALLCAFGVTLFVGLAPQAAAQFPPLTPWLEAIVRVGTLFIAAAGSYDLILGIKRDGQVNGS